MDFLLVFTLSLDTLFACLACGTDRIRIPLRSTVVIALVGSSCLALSLLLRGLLTYILPRDLIRWFGFSVLLLLGLTALFQAGIKRFLSARADSRQPLRFECFDLSLVLTVYADETRADVDHSKILSPREAFLLAIPLSADSLVTGLSISASPLKSLFLLLFSFLIGTLFAKIGVEIGRRAASASKISLSWLSGLLLIGIALWKVL